MRIFRYPPWYTIEDFIGMVTVLESLVSDGTGELKYKVSLRTAILLKGVFPEVRKTFEDVKRVYDKRSEMVHGNVIPKRFSDEFVGLKMLASRYAKYSIIEYIKIASQGLTKKEIIRKLDDQALGVR